MAENDSTTREIVRANLTALPTAGRTVGDIERTVDELMREIDRLRCDAYNVGWRELLAEQGASSSPASRQALAESIAIALVHGCAFEMAVEPRTDLVAKFSHGLASLLRPDEESSS